MLFVCCLVDGAARPGALRSDSEASDVVPPLSIHGALESSSDEALAVRAPHVVAGALGSPSDDDNCEDGVLIVSGRSSLVPVGVLLSPDGSDAEHPIADAFVSGAPPASSNLNVAPIARGAVGRPKGTFGGPVVRSHLKAIVAALPHGPPAVRLSLCASIVAADLEAREVGFQGRRLAHPRELTSIGATLPKRRHVSDAGGDPLLTHIIQCLVSRERSKTLEDVGVAQDILKIVDWYFKPIACQRGTWTWSRHQGSRQSPQLGGSYCGISKLL